jgi:hypothetical protein
MKDGNVFIAFMVFLIFAWPPVAKASASRQESLALHQLVKDGADELSDLGIDFPEAYFKTPAGQKTAERFKDSVRGLRQLASDARSGMPMDGGSLRYFISELRKVGLMIPFGRLDAPDYAIEHYIRAVDKLLFASRLLFTEEEERGTSAVWNWEGIANHALEVTLVENSLNYREANQYCENRGKGWRLPTWIELLVLARHGLKDERRNSAFGREVSTRKYLWASQKTADPKSEPPYVFSALELNPAYDEMAPKNQDEKLSVVCVKTAETGSGSTLGAYTGL